MIWIDPNTASVVSEGGENLVPAFVSIRDGILHANLRSQTRETFLLLAEKVGLLINEEGTLRAARGVTFTELGPLAISVDSEGKPLVVDKRHHVNFWLSPEATSSGNWVGWALAWTFQGKTITKVNKLEDGVVYQGIELIDPDTISSPSNILFK